MPVWPCGLRSPECAVMHVKRVVERQMCNVGHVSAAPNRHAVGIHSCTTCLRWPSGLCCCVHVVSGAFWICWFARMVLHAVWSCTPCGPARRVVLHAVCRCTLRCALQTPAADGTQLLCMWLRAWLRWRATWQIKDITVGCVANLRCFCGVWLLVGPVGPYI
jgi:hypothetical protein